MASLDIQKTGVVLVCRRGAAWGRIATAELAALIVDAYGAMDVFGDLVRMWGNTPHGGGEAVSAVREPARPRR